MKRVLCVEDDDETADLLKEALADLGYAVQRACDGPAGLAMILSQPPDLVLCDVGMPGMNGFEILERVVATGLPSASIPFVFLTALGDRNSELLGRRLGADGYLTKPIDFEMLGVVIENRLRRVNVPGLTNVHLTDREREVLTWVGRGKTSGEIAAILGLRQRTVNFHCDQAARRLDVVNRTQAVAKAIAGGLISL